MNGDPRPGLPAPYESPWRLLARDLRAVAASLGLKLRELARRNRTGDLPVPSFWPRGARALFWPVAVLAVAAGLGLLVLVAVPRPGAIPAPEAGGVPAPAAPPPATSPPAAPAIPEERPPGTAASPEVGPGGGPPPSSPAATPATAPPPAGPEPEARETETEANPLRAALAGPEEDPLVLTASADPATGDLQLTLAPGFGSLGTRERERRAERWRRRALDLGYERLRLEDGRGALLGRSALVGSGMILLETPVSDG